MLRGWAVLLVFQLVGEIVSRAAGWPVPGPVVGMALLLVALELRLPQDEGLRTVSSGLLSHLSILFVPAGVGVMLHAPRLLAEGPALLAALVVSTAATLAVTGLVATAASRGHEDAHEGRR
jgi:holin-like protein